MAVKLFDTEVWSMEDIDRNIEASLSELYLVQSTGTEGFQVLEDTQNSIERKRGMLNNIETYSMEQISNEISYRPDYSMLGIEITTYSLESNGSYHGLYFSLEEDKGIVGKVIDFIKKVIKSITDAIKKVFKWIGKKLGLVKEGGDKVLENIESKRNSISSRFIDICVVDENRPSKLNYTNIDIGYTQFNVHETGYDAFIKTLKEELTKRQMDDKIVNKIEEYSKNDKDITTINSVGTVKLYWNVTTEEFRKILDKLTKDEQTRINKQYTKDDEKIKEAFRKMKESNDKRKSEKEKNKPKDTVIEVDITVDTYTNKDINWINENFQTLLLFDNFTESFFKELSTGGHVRKLDAYISDIKKEHYSVYHYGILGETTANHINKLLKSTVVPVTFNGEDIQTVSVVVCDRRNVGLLAYYKSGNALFSYKHIKTRISNKESKYLPKNAKIINDINAKNIEEFLDSKETYVTKLMPVITEHENRFTKALEATTVIIKIHTEKYDKKTKNGLQLGKGELEALKTMSTALPRALIDSAVSYTNLYQDTLKLTNMEVNTVTQTK